MKIYLVGGAVRDQLLGKPVKEKDWVVVGASEHDMLQKGFRQVGKDFPVFLHPKTKEEYALARKERKIGKGYTGFEFDTTPNVTLEEDLLRRDITINAMAQLDGVGPIIDPYGGQEDLDNEILRHVSPAFAEDPVRILRIGRFAARFKFNIAPETLELMREMVKAGEVDALVPERVWKELERALTEPFPWLFFKALSECGAMPILFPSIKMNGAGMNILPYIKPYVHLRFAGLVHNLDHKTITFLCERYKIPHYVRDLALLVNQYLPDYKKAQYLNAEELMNLFQHVDAFRREPRFKDSLKVCQIFYQASEARLKDAFDIAKNTDVTEAIKFHQGKAIAEEIYKLRCKAINEWLTADDSNIKRQV